jgi:hypothetical protein
MEPKEQVRRKKIHDLEAQERDLLAAERVIEQRRLSLRTHRVPPGDRAWVEADRALATNRRELAALRAELHQTRRLA